MPSITQLKRAVVLSEKIEELQKELAETLGVGFSSSSTPGKKRGRPAKEVSVESEAAPKKRKKRKMSPEGLERIRAAQAKRWAAVRKAAKAEK